VSGLQILKDLMLVCCTFSMVVPTFLVTKKVISDLDDHVYFRKYELHQQ